MSFTDGMPKCAGCGAVQVNADRAGWPCEWCGSHEVTLPPLTGATRFVTPTEPPTRTFNNPSTTNTGGITE